MTRRAVVLLSGGMDSPPCSRSRERRAASAIALPWTTGSGTALGVDYALTVSCYQATEEGLACARCDACRIRRAGFEAAGVADPTRYRT